MHVVIHAGPPKTASSTLQWVLWRNRDALRAAGIEYLHTEHPDEWRLVALYRKAEWPIPEVLAARFSTQQEMRAWSAQGWADLEDRLERTRADTMLISSEHFGGVYDKPALVARLRQRADRLSVVAYVRDPVALYASIIDEYVRLGHEFAKLPKPGRFRYPMHGFRGYAPLLTDDALVLRSFRPDDLVGGDVVTDFFYLLSSFCGREIGAEFPRARLNQGMPGAASLWLMSANALGPFLGDAGTRRQALIKALRADPTLEDLPRLQMTDPEIATAIRVNNCEILDWLNAGPLAHAPLQSASADAALLPAEELEERLRRWLLSYGRDDHMRRVTEAVMRHESQRTG